MITVKIIVETVMCKISMSSYHCRMCIRTLNYSANSIVMHWLWINDTKIIMYYEYDNKA